MSDVVSDAVGQVFEKVPCRRQQVQLLNLLFGQVCYVSGFLHHLGVARIVGFLSSTLSYYVNFCLISKSDIPVNIMGTWSMISVKFRFSLFLFFPFARSEVLPVTSSPPHLIVFFHPPLSLVFLQSSSSPAFLTSLTVLPSQYCHNQSHQ